jgi:acyl-CoA thioesterase II
MFELESHGPDTFVGQGPQYPWGGLYGGQVVAQALRAAARSVEGPYEAHSIRAYFIRRGEHTEPVRYEVDRIRNGRSFVTRRVVARQAVGAILNAECSFQVPEQDVERQTVDAPDVPPPDELEESSWTPVIHRRFVPGVEDAVGSGAGRVVAWMRVDEQLGDGGDPAPRILHRCWLAYLSDDLPTDSVRAAHPVARDESESEHFVGTSLDHTMWFHRPMRADRWHLHDVSCHNLIGGRGLAVGHVFTDDGAHVATFAQEVLLRDRRRRPR